MARFSIRVYSKIRDDNGVLFILYREIGYITIRYGLIVGFRLKYSVLGAYMRFFWIYQEYYGFMVFAKKSAVHVKICKNVVINI